MMKTLTFISLMILVGTGCTATIPGDSSAPAHTLVPTPLERVNLSKTGLKVFPMEILRNRSIVELNISENVIDGAMPAEIRHLKHLKSLDASGNRMTGVPAEIGQLSKLEVLNLSNNLLTGLPHELGNLSNLKILNLKGNDISATDLEIIRSAIPDTKILVD